MDPDRLLEVWRLNLGRYDHLIEDFFKAQALQFRAQDLIEADQMQPAIEALRQSITYDSTRAASWFLLGVALYREGHIDEAYPAVQKALKIHPFNKTYRSAHSAFIQVFLEGEQYVRAEEACRLALELMPESPEAYYNMGVARYYQGFEDEAIRLIQTAIRMNPEDPLYNEALKKMTAQRPSQN